MASCCEHSNEPSGFIKCGEFLSHVRDYALLSDLSGEILKTS
jgi:hypothetical protein